jgi:hypothetical protein
MLFQLGFTQLCFEKPYLQIAEFDGSITPFAKGQLM